MSNVHGTMTSDTVINTRADADRAQFGQLSDNSDSHVSVAQNEAFHHVNTDGTDLRLCADYKTINKSTGVETYLDIEFSDIHVDGDIYLSEYAYRQGDPDTNLRFRDDRLTASIGGIEFMDFTEGASDIISFDPNGTGILVGIGTDDPDTELHVEGDVTIRNGTPRLEFKDSSCTDDDINAWMYASAQTTDSGAEDIDVYFQQQIGGSLTGFLSSESLGFVTLGDGTRDIVLDGGDVTAFLGDNAGAEYFYVKDSDGVARLTVDSLGNATISGDMFFAAGHKFNTGPGVLGANTSDGSDDGSIAIAGGPSTDPSRGAYIQAFGNEYFGSNEGALVLAAGNEAADGSITFRTQSTLRTTIAYDGTFSHTGDFSITGTSTLVGDVFIDATLPGLYFRDTNCTDYLTDPSAYILASATDTGSGTEDVDMSFTQQIAGNATVWFSSDADGTIDLGDGTRTINLLGPTVFSKAVIATPDEITATSSGTAASVETVNTEVTTNGDSDLDNVTLANGTGGKIKCVYCVAVGNAADSFKITPANMVGGTQITFPANPIGLGCILVYADGKGWVVVANNGGTIS